MLARLRLLAPALLLIGAGPLAAQDADLRARSQRGSELMAAGRYAEAVPVYRELVQAAPGNAGLLTNLGMALHLSGQDREAVPQLEAALKIQPDSLPASLFLGAANLRLGKPAAAVAPLRKAVRLQGDHREARSMMAEALLVLDRHAEAEPHLHRLSQLAPADPAVWFQLGKTYEVLTSRAFEALLERDPESPFALALVAEARLAEGRQAAAFQLLRKVLERAPSMRGLHASVAGIYREQGHPDWAAVEEGKERALPKADCAREALECAFAAGKHREVLAAASKEKTAAASYWTARACNELAVQAFGRLAALPPSAPGHEWAATQMRNEARYAESAEEWRKAITLAPDDSRLKLELAIEGVLGSEPGSPDGSYLLGDVLLARAQPEAAVPHLEKAVRLAPQLLEASSALGRAYALVGRPADAIPHLEKALPTDTDGSLRLQLARAYQAAGQAEAARRALADYQEYRKASGAGSQAQAEAPAITPP
jgi:tetratricopeptide (TPR) repeat protein